MWLCTDKIKFKMEASLQTKAEQQFNRLMEELSDLESLKNDLDSNEYEEMKNEILEQLEEFKKFKENPLLKDSNKVNDVGLGLKTPEILQMFTNKSTDGLRQKLTELERDVKVGKITKVEYDMAKTEILKALLKLNQITENEKKFLIQLNNPDLLSIDDSDSAGTIEDSSKVYSVIQK